MTTRDELEAINLAFSEALAQQDVDRLLTLYESGAMLLFSGMPIVRGRSEIEAFFREDLAVSPSTIRFETGDVFEGEGLVVDVGRYVTPDGGGKYVVVYRRGEDGALRLLVDSASGDGRGDGGDS